MNWGELVYGPVNPDGSRAVGMAYNVAPEILTLKEEYGFEQQRRDMTFIIYKDMILAEYRERPSEISKEKIKKIANLAKESADTFFECQMEDLNPST